MTFARSKGRQGQYKNQVNNSLEKIINICY